VLEIKSYGGMVPRILNIGTRRRWMVGFKSPLLFFRCKSQQPAWLVPKVICTLWRREHLFLSKIWPLRSIRGLSQRGCQFNRRQVNVCFVVKKRITGQIFLRVIRISC